MSQSVRKYVVGEIRDCGNNGGNIIVIKVNKFTITEVCKFLKFGGNKVIATQLYRDCHVIMK